MVFECGLNWITGCYITITPKNIKPAHNIASPFYYEMVRYQEEYLQYLLFQKLNMRAITHADIINAFINYLFKYNLVADFNQITVAMVKSQFYFHYNEIENIIPVSRSCTSCVSKIQKVFIQQLFCNPLL
jgi:bacterioferritin-associated ferredoxin